MVIDIIDKWKEVYFVYLGFNNDIYKLKLIWIFLKDLEVIFFNFKLLRFLRKEKKREKI